MEVSTVLMINMWSDNFVQDKTSYTIIHLIHSVPHRKQSVSGVDFIVKTLFIFQICQTLSNNFWVRKEVE